MTDYPQINAGKYRHKIQICQAEIVTDENGFQAQVLTEILSPYADIKTTKGFTIIKNNSDFEKALTNFTIRYPQTEITREMVVLFRGKTYEILYLNNVNEACVELEIQAKEVTH
jgi:head-tail adaptor